MFSHGSFSWSSRLIILDDGDDDNLAADADAAMALMLATMAALALKLALMLLHCLQLLAARLMQQQPLKPFA